MVARPPFEVEITKKSGRKLTFMCEFTSQDQVYDGENAEGIGMPFLFLDFFSYEYRTDTTLWGCWSVFVFFLVILSRYCNRAWECFYEDWFGNKKSIMWIYFVFMFLPFFFKIHLKSFWHQNDIHYDTLTCFRWPVPDQRGASGPAIWHQHNWELLHSQLSGHGWGIYSGLNLIWPSHRTIITVTIFVTVLSQYNITLST